MQYNTSNKKFVDFNQYSTPKFNFLLMIAHSRKLLLLAFFVLISCSSENEEPDPVVIDSTPPTVQIGIEGFSTLSGSTPVVVSNRIVVAIAAEDSNGIAKVEAFIDNQKVGEDTTAPYEISIDVSQLSSKSAAGKYTNYTLRIDATDTSGNITSVEQLINVDNELPVISDVSIVSGVILATDTNSVTFSVMDNEGITSVGVYINNELQTEFSDGGALETNINSTLLADGQQTLKIEATDVAGNIASFEVDFITDNTGPSISLENLIEGSEIDELVVIAPEINDEYSEVASVEITYNTERLLLEESATPVSYEFNPEEFEVGEGTFEIIAIDALGNSATFSLTAIIQRRLLEINIPEDHYNPAISAAVVFLSRMDGSLISWKEILPEDRQLIFSVAESFEPTTEFMVTFYLEDNGGIASLTTHQNITRTSPGVFNLKRPPRPEGVVIERPITNFLSNDGVVGDSASSNGNFQSSDDAPARYTVFMDTSQELLSVVPAEDPMLQQAFDQVYVTELFSFKNMLIPNPPPADFIFDKANLRDDNLENGQLTVSSPVTLDNTNSLLFIAGALSAEEDMANLYHQMFVWNRVGFLDTPMEYSLNSTFYSYRHALQFGNYFTERKGTPLDSYTVPNLSFDYSITNNELNLSIQGNEHLVGRAQCVDFDNLTYVWHLTFNSQTTTNVLLPELPPSISHPVENAYDSGTIKVEKVELISYGSISTYDEFRTQLMGNQTNLLEANDWYQLIYKSRTGDFNTPIRQFLFQ